MFKLPISKYKNVTPKLVKKEQCMSGISTNRLLNTIGTLINCNLNYVTFAYDTSSGSSNICTITQNDVLRKSTFSADSFTTTYAHSGSLTDIQFSYFDSSILATSAYDSQINLWSLNTNDDETDTKVSVTSLDSLVINDSRCDCIQWNFNCENILASVSLSNLYVWDVENKVVVNSLKSHTDAIQSMSWKRDGAYIVTTSKDKTMQVFDPRISNEEALKIEGPKTNNKDSKAVWVGTSDLILSSVYTLNHQRETHLWDIRNTSAPCSETSIDIGNNVHMTLYDYDTGILFLAGKAESTIKYCEVTTEPPNVVLNSVQSIDDQIKGFCMLPKFGLDLMKCEIDRLLLLTRNSVYPVPYYVPRRSYYEFQQDVYPETYVFKSNIEKSNWLNGENDSLTKILLNPDTQKVYNPKLSGLLTAQNMPTSNTQIQNDNQTEKDLKNSENEFKKPQTNVDFKIIRNNENDTRNSNLKPLNNEIEIKVKDTNSNESNNENRLSTCNDARPVTPSADARPCSYIAPPKIGKSKSVYYQSKFKYISGKSAHKSEHITNIRNLSTMWPSECNGFQVNPKYAAYLISGTSGQIGVVELNKSGRLIDANILVNKSKVSDFAWDPFDDDVLAVGCDDGIVKIWRLSTDEVCTKEEPTIQLKGHQERCGCIRYHPYAKNVLASASYDRTVKIWNIGTEKAVKTLVGHTDVIFHISWSICAEKLATICKDGYVRVYEPLKSESPILEAKTGLSAGSKAARIEWASNGNCLLISGFGKSNSRQLILLNAFDLTQLQVEELNQSPSLLIPYYDADIDVVYLFAKGEETIFLYEIQENEPYFQVLTPHKADGLHFGLGFLPKQYCDVKAVEIAKAYRLTKDNRIEPVSFTVPRVKLTYFQDDVYPDTIDRSKPYLQADEWFESKYFEVQFISLQPPDMQKLSEIQAIEQEKNLAAKREKKVDSSQNSRSNMIDENGFGDEEKKIINTMLQRASLYKKEADTDEEDHSDWN